MQYIQDFDGMMDLDSRIKELANIHGLSHILEAVADLADRHAERSEMIGQPRSPRNLRTLAERLRKARAAAFPDVQPRTTHIQENK